MKLIFLSQNPKTCFQFCKKNLSCVFCRITFLIVSFLCIFGDSTSLMLSLVKTKIKMNIVEVNKACKSYEFKNEREFVLNNLSMSITHGKM